MDQRSNQTVQGLVKTADQSMHTSQQSQKNSCPKCKKLVEEWSKFAYQVRGKEERVCRACEVEWEFGKTKEKYFKESGLPTKYSGIVTSRPEIVEKLLTSNRGGYVWGDVGTGKTTVCANLLRRLTLEKGIQAKFISSTDVVMKLQDMYRKSTESPYDYLKYLTRVDCLFLDDLGAEKLTDFVKQSFYFLINEREQWEKRTFITSNYSLDDLDGIFESRISSRIAGMCEVIEFKGKDRRIS